MPWYLLHRYLFDLLVAAGGPFDAACFHAQQAAEKCLKAVLSLNGVVPSRSHDIGDLAERCSPFLPGLIVNESLLSLTEFAVGLRYDAEFWPDGATAAAARDTALEVHALTLAIVDKASIE